MKTVATTLAGSTHIKNSIPCQDAVQVYRSENFTIMVLSDGAGSKKYALESAELLTELTVDYFKDFLVKCPLDAFDGYIFSTYIEKCFYAKGYTAENAGATLIFAVIIGNRYLIGHMGDGVAIIENSGGYSVVSYPENGEYINETFFFPGENSHQHLRLTIGNLDSTSSAILLTSDGISDFLYDYQSGEIANVVRLMVSWARDYSESKCVEVLRNNFRTIFSEYSADDKSIAIACTES